MGVSTSEMPMSATSGALHSISSRGQQTCAAGSGGGMAEAAAVARRMKALLGSDSGESDEESDETPSAEQAESDQSDRHGCDDE